MTTSDPPRAAAARPTVLVTGGSRGVGLALASAWLRRGARVMVTGRDEARLEAARQALVREARDDGEVMVFRGDLAREDVRRDLVAFVRERARVLDVLVNNAALQGTSGLTAGDPLERAAEAEREIATNLVAPIALAVLLLPLLQAACRPGREAVIINITSGLALAPKASAPVYCGTKAGLRTFGTALRWQLARAAPGVRVVEAMLPLVDTDMAAGRGRGKLPPAEVAEAILRGLDAGRTFIPVGKVRLLRALWAIAPTLVEPLLRDS